MRLDDQRTWALLRDLDDSDYLEQPRNYNHRTARARLDQLATELDRRFHCTCAVDRDVQDASHHATIIIPSTATSSPDHITITISNFGNLAAVTLGNPGSYEPDEERELFHDTDRNTIDETLDTLDYTAVSEHLLWTRYDGASDLATHYPPQHPPTWWTRFFDYL
jgi:hypothetical protein